MRNDLTDVTIVLDRSGSMSSIADDTRGGVNTFLAEQAAQPGECRVTLALFDHEYAVVHDAVPAASVPPLDRETFQPRGSTALLDAIGRSVVATGARLGAMAEADRPGKVVFVIVTDGHENASREFDRARVREMVEHQKAAYSWDFVYLGANQDAIRVGGSMGILAANSMTYAANAAGTRSAFASASRGVSTNRLLSAAGHAAADYIGAEDRAAQAEAGVASK